jgi:hypothetical protein
MVEVDCLGVVGGCFGLQDAIKQPSKQAARVRLRKSAPPLRKTLLLAVGASQRLALPAAGEKKAWKRETAKAQEKGRKTPSPSRPVHAVLGGNYYFSIRASQARTSGSWSS